MIKQTYQPADLWTFWPCFILHLPYLIPLAHPLVLLASSNPSLQDENHKPATNFIPIPSSFSYLLDISFLFHLRQLLYHSKEQFEILRVLDTSHAIEDHLLLHTSYLYENHNILWNKSLKFKNSLLIIRFTHIHKFML